MSGDENDSDEEIWQYNGPFKIGDLGLGTITVRMIEERFNLPHRTQPPPKKPPVKEDSPEPVWETFSEPDITSPKKRPIYEFDTIKDIPPEEKIKILEGVTCFVDNKEKNRVIGLDGVTAELLSLGAKITDVLSSNVTHVVFREGEMSNYLAAKRFGIPLVGLLWLEECKRTRKLVDPSLYPPSGIEEYEAQDPDTVRPEQLSQVLAGITCFLDIDPESILGRINHLETLLEELGATIITTFTNAVSIVIFLDGQLVTYSHAKRNDVPIVNPYWAQECKRLVQYADPALFPPNDFEKYDTLMAEQESKKVKKKRIPSTSSSPSSSEEIDCLPSTSSSPSCSAVFRGTRSRTKRTKKRRNENKSQPKKCKHLYI